MNTITSKDWREFFDGDLTRLADIQTFEDVDANGHMKNRVRFSARLAEAYKIAGPVLLARISGQVVQMLRMWIDSKTALPGPNLIQSAWIKWLLEEAKQDSLPPIGSPVSGQKIADLRRLAALIEQDYSSDYGSILENPMDGHQAEEYDLLAEARLNDYWQKVRKFNQFPTEENAEAIERDPHLQKVFSVFFFV